MVGDHAAQMLEALIFVLDGTLEPVFAVQVHDHAALVEAVLALKFRFYQEGEEFFVGLHLEHRGVVVSEMVIGPLPQIRMGLGYDLHLVIRDREVFRFPGPPEIMNGKAHHHTAFFL